MTTNSLSLRPGYWCECSAHRPTETNIPRLLASFDATSATQAVRWIRVAIWTIASALAPEASVQAWTWIINGQAATHSALAHGKPATLTINNGGTLNQWTARPALFLPLTHRQQRDLPTCAEQFPHHLTQPGFHQPSHE